MAAYLTIARPYARALFSDAKGNDALFSAWTNVLQVLSYIMDQAAMKNFANDPRTTSIVAVLTELVNQVAASEVALLGEKFDNFLQLLIKHKRLGTVADILIILKALINEAQNVTEATVTSAYAIDDELREKVKRLLVNKFKTKMSIKYAVDKNLIGGAIIRTDKFVIDGSIKGKLTSLHQSLESIKG